ncbi:MAG: DUF3617 domain-containing protein [Sphingomonas bacterium]|nr:DUF3617 domain-containing protein [Sphingomonas bacterium]
MIRFWMAAGTLAMLAACGSETATPAKVEKPKTMVAGGYEIVSEVTKLVSTDKSTPATPLKLGDKQTIRACVAADGTPDPKMFVEEGDICTANHSYGRSGRLSIQYTCNRAGKGELYPNADGNYTADGYKALVTVATAFAGDGDYALTRTLTAKRIGACPAAGPAKS